MEGMCWDDDDKERDDGAFPSLQDLFLKYGFHPSDKILVNRQ